MLSRYRVDCGSGIYFQRMPPEPVRQFLQLFVRETSYSGQVGFDFIEGSDGHFHVLECNPWAISGVHLFDNQQRSLVQLMQPPGAFYFLA